MRLVVRRQCDRLVQDRLAAGRKRKRRFDALMPAAAAC
jgi:hypothetical protein